MTYPNALALAQRLKKPLVVFDIEHTGGLKATRAITEFAAYVLHPDGRLIAYTSLVKPAEGAVFSQIVSRITGIHRSTVAKAPAWPEVYAKFVAEHVGSVWVGFNSRASDTPIILEECRRYGLPLESLVAQLDVMRIPCGKGSLSVRAGLLVPNLDTKGAHRAAKDALMTLALLDAVLPSLTDENLIDQGLLARARVAKPTEEPVAGPDAVRLIDPRGYLVPGELRHGVAWRSGEADWAAAQFRGGEPLESLAGSIGRTPRSLAFVLHRYGLLSPELRAAHKVS